MTKPKLFTAFGKALSCRDWLHEPECVHSSYTTLKLRLRRLSPEEAISGARELGAYEAFGETKGWSEWLKDPRITVTPRTIRTRMYAQGMSFEEAATALTKNESSLVTIDGESKLLTDWAKDPRCTVEFSTVFARVSKGWETEDALFLPNAVTKNPTYEAFGEHKTLYQWLKDPRCEARSIGWLQTLIDRGWIFEDALKSKFSATQFECFGQNQTLEEWAQDRRCVVPLVTLRSRMHGQGWSIEDAITEPITSLSSIKERELSDFVFSLGLDISSNDRTIISPRELDIYIPDKNLAIEYNGIYWHNELYKNQTYHYDKWKQCHDKGIQLIQIWEDDWRDRPEVVRSMLRYKLGLSEGERIFARKTIVDPNVSWSEVEGFLDRYHIQGAASASFYYGLRFDGRLVALSCFVRSHAIADWDLNRFCTSGPVVGGFSKLLKAFRLDHGGSIKSFADLSVSDGRLYREHGFRLDKTLSPDYSYVVDNTRVHKFGYRKSRFKEDQALLYEDGLTEAELANLNKIYRIYDAGKLRFVLD